MILFPHSFFNPPHEIKYQIDCQIRRYVAKLETAMPALMAEVRAGTLELVTEFGRAIFAKAGCVASLVELVSPKQKKKEGIIRRKNKKGVGR